MMKKMLVPVALLLVCTLLGGCFNANTQPAATPTPAPNGALPGMTMTPQNTMGPGVAAPPDQGSNASASYDWPAKGAAVEGRIGMFSEIKECKLVVAEDTALVGVRFADAYQGEMTQRIRDMIAGEIMAVDQKIQVVAVTSEDADVRKIYELANLQHSGQTPENFKQQVDEIARNTTTLR